MHRAIELDTVVGIQHPTVTWFAYWPKKEQTVPLDPHETSAVLEPARMEIHFAGGGDPMILEGEVAEKQFAAQFGQQTPPRTNVQVATHMPPVPNGRRGR